MRREEIEREIHPARGAPVRALPRIVGVGFQIGDRHAVPALLEDVQFGRNFRPAERRVQRDGIFGRDADVLVRRPQKDGRRVGGDVFFQRICGELRRVAPAEIIKGIPVPTALIRRDDGIAEQRRVGPHLLAFLPETRPDRAVPPEEGDAARKVTSR